MSTTQPITVIGATGQQGSAVLTELVQRGATVRAVTRDPTGTRAQDLAAPGVEFVGADLADVDTVRDAFEGAAAAFAMTTFDVAGGTDGEVKLGRVIADAAESAGLPFLVYSSVGGAERHTGIPHFESKGRIEELLLDAVPVSFVRPTFFMDNLHGMVHRDDGRVQIAMPLPDGIPLQMISVRDIGRVAVELLTRADATAAPVEIAGDELTGSQIADRVAGALDLPATYSAAPVDVLGEDEDRKTMFRWFTQQPAYQADFDRTRQLVPDVEDLATWLGRAL